MSKSKRMSSARIASQAKAGKRSGPHQRPPYPTRTPQELLARQLRRNCLHGAFGWGHSPEVYNLMIVGTNGRPHVSAKQLADAKQFISQNNEALVA